MKFLLHFNKPKYENKFYKQIRSLHSNKNRIPCSATTIKYFIIVYLVVYALFLITIVVHFDDWQKIVSILNSESNRQIHISSDANRGQKTYVHLGQKPAETYSLFKKCYLTMDVCFDFYSCVLSNLKRPNNDGSSLLKVFIYNLSNIEFVDDEHPPKSDVHKISLKDSFSVEFIEMVETIRQSKFYESNPKHACLFLPEIDLLNGNNFDGAKIERILNKLK
jgi:hypothetical protein